DRIGRIGVRFPEGASPLRVPQVEVEMVDEHHLPAPVHVRMRPLLLTLSGPRAPRRRLLLADADQYHSLVPVACGGFKIGPGDFLLVLTLLEMHQRNLVLLGEAMDRLDVRVTNLAERSR